MAKIVVTDNAELRETILQGIKRNKEVHGKGYCPCVNPKFYNDEVVCMCKEFKEMDEGTCHCGLYVKTKTS